MNAIKDYLTMAVLIIMYGVVATLVSVRKVVDYIAIPSYTRTTRRGSKSATVISGHRIKLTWTIAALLMLVPMASAVGQTQLTCSTLQNQDVTVCDKTVRGSHIYTVEEQSSIGFSIKRVTAAKVSKLLKTEQELTLVHAISDMKIKQAELRRDLKHIAGTMCLSIAGSDERLVGSTTTTVAHWEKVTPVTFDDCFAQEARRIDSTVDADTDRYEANLRDINN
jgi:hypothetical protein